MKKYLDATSTIELLQDSKFYYIICTDNDGLYSYVNSRYSESFCFIADELVGKPYYITMHPEDRAICEEVGAKCYQNPGKLFPAIIRKHDGKGDYVVTQWEFTLMEKDGQPTGIFCLGYDITEYVRVYNKNEELNHDLNLKEQIMNDIAFKQSHLVRSPLTNIMGLVSILKDLDLGPNAQSVIKMLAASADRLDEVIKAIIDKTDT